MKRKFTDGKRYENHIFGLYQGDLYLEYINNSYSSIIKRLITQFQNGQMM